MSNQWKFRSSDHHRHIRSASLDPKCINQKSKPFLLPAQILLQVKTWYSDQKCKGTHNLDLFCQHFGQIIKKYCPVNNTFNKKQIKVSKNVSSSLSVTRLSVVGGSPLLMHKPIGKSIEPLTKLKNLVFIRPFPNTTHSISTTIHTIVSVRSLN